MNDELTPELKKAIDKLPRERMPAGLEARVTDAMREHGFLAKRRRTIAITSGRVAGLVAACLALVIGGYSIGLQRGGSGVVLPEVATLERDDTGRANESTSGTLEKKEEAHLKTQPAADEPVQTEPAKAPIERPATAQPTPAEAAKPDVAAETRSDEGFRPFEADKDRLAASPRAAAPTPAREEPAAKAMLDESADRAQARPSISTSEISKRSMTFMLNGSPVVIDAPDSVRITKDESGRMLLIYTSDGVIRIRLAEDD